MSKVDMKVLGETLLQNVLEAGKRFKSGEMDFQSANAVFLENREVCRLLGLQNKIAENAKRSPARHLQEFAGLED